MKLSELARLTGASVDGGFNSIEITGAAGLDDAGPSDVSFLANPRYTGKVNTTRAAAVYLAEGAQTDRAIAVLRTKDPYLAYTRALRLFHPEPGFAALIHESAVLDPSSTVAGTARVGAGVVIGPGCQIGEGVHIYPNVTIYENVAVGRDSII